LGILFGFGMVILGFTLEQGKVESLLLLSPAVIVFGGTLGAVMLSYSMNEIKRLPKIILEAFRAPRFNTSRLIEILVSMAELQRKEGLLSLEKYIIDLESREKINPILKKSTLLAIDGTDTQVIRDILHNDLDIYDQRKKIDASVFESAGGFSPTLGIIGTVVGLIRVLSSMSTPEALAESIAVAFVATLYGVCFANLVYLPIAAKLRLQIKYHRTEAEMIIDAVCAIRNGENPKMLQERLDVYKNGKSNK
jgi:chemotaxis protein MotA